MNTKSSKLLLFPGLAADENLFRYQIDNLHEVVVPEWQIPEKGENLQDYCARWASKLEIGPNDYIGGMSFGGQVALEIAKHVKCAGCFLISANRSGKEISAQFRLQNQLLKKMPESFVKLGLKNMAIPQLKNYETLDELEIEWLLRMVDEMDFDFFKWSTNPAAKWDYEFNAEDFKTPVFQIHGENDPIIKLESFEEVTVLKGAGHLICFTHAKELNEWLNQKMQKSS